MEKRTQRNLINRGAQKKAALIVGLLMMTILTIIGVIAANGSVAQQRMANNYRFSIEAMNNAEVGYISALNLMNDQTLALNGFDDELDPNGDGVFDDRFSLTSADQDSNVFFTVVMVDDDDGDGDPSVDSNGIVRLMSQGTSGVGSTRTIEVRIAASVGGGAPIQINSAILTEGSLTISGDMELSGTNQDIHSNASIDISGNPTTDGTVSAVGSITVSGNPAGDITIAPGATNVDIPQIDPSMFAEYADYVFHSNGDIYDGDDNAVANADGVAWQGWKFGGDKWTTEGNNVQGGMLYFEGDYGNVVVGGSIGSPGDPWAICILADGYIEISGNPTIENYADPDDPPAVQALLFLSGSDIKINGNPDQTYTGLIYAADQLDVNGNPIIDGALIAADRSNDSTLVDQNSFSGTLALSYGDGFSFPWVDGGGYGTAIVLSWRDREIARGTDVFAPVGETHGETGY